MGEHVLSLHRRRPRPRPARSTPRAATPRRRSFTRVAEELSPPTTSSRRPCGARCAHGYSRHDERFDEAVVLADEAVELLATTDGLVKHADALLVLAGVLALAGRVEEAEDAGAEALALYERKGNAVSARAARDVLARLRIELAS